MCNTAIRRYRLRILDNDNGLIVNDYLQTCLTAMLLLLDVDCSLKFFALVAMCTKLLCLILTEYCIDNKIRFYARNQLFSPHLIFV